MRKKFPQIIIILFAAIFFLQIAALVFLLLTPSMAGAASVDFTPQVGVGADFTAGVSQPVNANTIGTYIKAVYQYGIGIVGIVAAVVMMFGGILWLTAGGESGRVTEAKEWIKAALFGLILALLSYTILLTVNPDLVNFKTIEVKQVKKSSLDSNSQPESSGDNSSNDSKNWPIIEKNSGVAKSEDLGDGMVIYTCNHIYDPIYKKYFDSSMKPLPGVDNVTINKKEEGEGSEKTCYIEVRKKP